MLPFLLFKSQVEVKCLPKVLGHDFCFQIYRKVYGVIGSNSYQSLSTTN